MTPKSIERLNSLGNSKLQLVAITCALIASKWQEIDSSIIRIFELEKEFRYKYTFKNITN